MLGRSLAGSDATPITFGEDLSGNPAMVGALLAARSTGGVATSASYERDGERLLVMAAAVVAPVPAAGAERLRGWVIMSFRGREFLGPPVGFIGGDQVNVEFADISGDTPVTIVTWRTDAAPHVTIPPWSVDLPGQWRLTVTPTVRLVPKAEAWLAPGAAAIGSVITVLLATLTAMVVTSRDRALRRVDEATVELRDDIERREAVEQRLRRREEELVGFAGVVAHDLRSPLAGLVGYAEMIDLADEGNLSEEQRGHLAKVRASAARMQALIDDLLAYATADNTTLRVTDVNLGELVESVVTERRPAAPDAVIECDPLPTVEGDPSQLRQVLDNLIGNALKYTRPGIPAHITISADGDPDNPGHIRTEVADEGIGIPESQLADVFNAFTRATGAERYPGTGLGLAIVQRIIERHNGAAGAAPNTPEGTRFWFTLPAKAQRPPTPEET